MSGFLTELLEHYHLTLKDLACRKAPGSFDVLKRPDGLGDYEKALARIRLALSKHEKIVLYGDYDVDGLTATAILKSTFDKLNYPVGYFIPSRYHEGYGLCSSRVEDFHKKGYSLVITLDNGITAFDAIAKAHKDGMDVVVIDHHEPQATLPEVAALFHQGLSGFLDYNCSAASLAFFVSWSLLGRPDPYFATLAGIAVFSDVMPLCGNNLVLAKLALSYLKQNRYPNLVSLLKGGEISYDALSFALIPSLNAVGRIRKEPMATNEACRFLIEKDAPETVAKLGQKILDANDERKQIVRSMTFLDSFRLESDHGLVLRTAGYGGISGLIANRILKEQKKGTLVLAPDDNNPDVLVGSLRLLEGYDSQPFLKEAQHYLLTSGGHSLASGLTLKAKDYYQVATLFLTVLEKEALEVTPAQEDTLPLALEDLNEANYEDYQSFLPFGEGFPAPVFAITVDSSSVMRLASGKAIVALSADKGSKILYFGDSELVGQERYASFTFTGSFTRETYQGQTTYELLAHTISGNLQE